MKRSSGVFKAARNKRSRASPNPVQKVSVVQALLLLSDPWKFVLATTLENTLEKILRRHGQMYQAILVEMVFERALAQAVQELCKTGKADRSSFT